MSRQCLGVLTVLLVLSGCVRRMPEPDVRVRCRAREVHFEQTAGACARYPSAGLAYDLLGARCDDLTLERVQQRLRQEPGSENVEVVRGPRLPGSSHHRVIIRYTSSEPGTCPVRPQTPAVACEDCEVDRVLTAMQPLPCDSKPFRQALALEVKKRARTCKAEELEAARAGLWKKGWFNRVDLICARSADGPVNNIYVDAGLEDPASVCDDFDQPLPESPRCSDAVPTGCARGMTCWTNWEGCRRCTCVSSAEWVLSILLRLPLEILTR